MPADGDNVVEDISSDPSTESASADDPAKRAIDLDIEDETDNDADAGADAEANIQ